MGDPSNAGAAGSAKLRRLPLIAGLLCIVLATAGIYHFVISGARAGFPPQMISASWNWIFIGGHGLLGLVGLVLLGFIRPGRKTRKAVIGDVQA